MFPSQSQNGSKQILRAVSLFLLEALAAKEAALENPYAFPAMLASRYRRRAEDILMIFIKNG